MVVFFLFNIVVNNYCLTNYDVSGLWKEAKNDNQHVKTVPSPKFTALSIKQRQVLYITYTQSSTNRLFW